MGSRYVGAWVAFCVAVAGCANGGGGGGDGTDAGPGAVDRDAFVVGFDGGTHANDAGVDAAVSTGVDAGPSPDAGPSAMDAGPTPVDAAQDGGKDAGFDSGPMPFDAGSDAGSDGGSDAGNDAGADAGSDAGHDGGNDAGRDAGTDAGPPDAGPPPSIIVVTVSPGNYVTGNQLNLNVTYSAAVTVTGTPSITLVIDGAHVKATYVSGSGTTLLVFRRIIAPGDVDSDGITVLSPISLDGGTIRDASSGINALLTFTPPDTSGVLVNSYLHCPSNFVLVPSNPLYGAADFCLAKYEMRPTSAVTPAGSGATSPPPATVPPMSSPTGDPYDGQAPSYSGAACALMGSGYRLMTNAEWQTVARNIEMVPENWSGDIVGSGMLNLGNISTEHGGASLIDDDACVTPSFASRFPACLNHSSTDFYRKRTHTLSTGATIWDIGGNATEWLPAPASSGAAASTCALGGADQTELGAQGTYDCSTTPMGFSSHGLGYVEGSGSSTLHRGGFAGAEGSPWNGAVGVFYANTNSFWSGYHPDAQIGFRCVYVPTSPPATPLTLFPQRTQIATGGNALVIAHGGTPPYTISMMTNASGGSFAAATGIYHAGPITGVTDTLRVMDAASNVSTASMNVVPTP